MTEAEQAWPRELLDAAEQAVREAPDGLTAAQAAQRVCLLLVVPGQPPPKPLSRGRMLAVLGVLEKRGSVTRQLGQAVVTFRPAEEGTGE